MDANGETASLKKRKREPKDEPSPLKRHRSKSKSKSQANGSPSKEMKSLVQSTVSISHPADDDMELSGTLTTRNELAQVPSAAWKVSNPMGGRMLDIDPIFSPDEQYLIITYNTSIQVYSTVDSLLVRRIALPLATSEPGANLSAVHIVASALSKTSPDHVWVASTDGRIRHINWTSGAGVDAPFTIETKKLLDMVVESAEFGDTTKDVLIVLQKLTGSTAQIVAYDDKALSAREGKLLHTCDEAPRLVRSAANGKLIVAAAKATLHIGLLKKRKATNSLDDLEYRFYSFNAPDLVACMDIRATTRTTKKGAIELGQVDLVIGGARGAIYLYNDVVSKLPSDGFNSSKSGSIQPRKSHWHRQAVHSVKWSADGNYLISGGYEAVLVLWQLDTNKLDFLPHLSATIENIVVSPGGSSYAIHFDDNSAMVLSTEEMKPTTYVSGIQSLVLSDQPSKEAMVRRVWKAPDEISTPLVTAVNPLNSSQILLCVGNGQQATLGGAELSTPQLQVFDISSCQGVAKHAIARTNPTDANITSQGAPIVEPRATKLAFSQDGKWLASVDEWQPPERDTEAFVTGSKTADQVCHERREIYLKFWKVGSEASSLELVTRVNEAHHTNQPETIFDLVSDPTSPRFATIGNDGLVRFWTSKLRRRDGLATTGHDGQQLRMWSCSRVVPLPTSVKQDSSIQPGVKRCRSGALAFSEDGSILFAAFGEPSEATIVAIDTETGSFRDVVYGMFRGEVRGIRSLGSCLIMLSEDLAVYDIVSDELLYSFSLKETSKSAKNLTQLAVNYESRSFALAAPIPNTNQDKMKKGMKSELVVFSLGDQEPKLVQTFPQLITSVLSAVSSAGYIIVDSAAQIWSVTEGAEQAPLLQPLANLGISEGVGAEMEVEHMENVLEDGEASDEEMQDVDMDGDMEEDYDTHPAVVAPQRLAEIFNVAPAFAMPPIEDIFYQVAGLFSAKPVQP
ncbi:WD40-repeat-containing domain protein [Lasiosphaeria hispida]|uniref:WD40-repeat-containing domain protein n=1 Tax=Lasiosphaeria hispida TaxID=260671 RepID=A0AAJ0M8G0_9PEZI|nr:WD40-repeat-containing domain protein [Lasiosphaeria hispida]